ncbi:MAG TPA: signal peptidase II [Syntrophus sp. (in: bacteria)]|nr:signal peptidase II [Syntrophus sp. (in: bacteria)]
MTKKNLIFLATVVILLILDHPTKYFIHTGMALHESIPVIPGWFNITYIRNPGAAFGFLAGASPTFRYVFFIGVTIAAIGLIIHYLRTYAAGDQLLTISLGMILSGAIGNLIDRVRFGEVIDFLDVYIGTTHWPAFNVADSAISVGAFILFFHLILQKKSAPGPLP